jgi:hypothetical protein
MRDLGAVARVTGLTVTVGFVFAACTSGQSQSQSQSQSPQPRSSASALAHPLSTKLHQQTGPRFFKNRKGPDPIAVTVLTSSRNLQPGQQGVVLTAPEVGNLVGSCSPAHRAVKFRLTNAWAGPPVVTEVRAPLARPIGLHLDAPYWPPAPSPAVGEQQFAFFQVVGGGESGDFSLALWATLTPVAGGCAFSTNGVLRIRGLEPTRTGRLITPGTGRSAPSS